MITVKERKHFSHHIETEKFPAPKKLYLPLSQHTGKPSQLLVALKDKVEESDLIAGADGLISAVLNAPKKATVAAIDRVAHPVLKKSLAVVLDTEPGEKDYLQRQNPDKLTKNELIEVIRQAGIVGMGGACFPTHVKLKPPKEVDTLIINGCECEPYLACDYRLMLEQSESILAGVEVIARIVSARQVIFAIEDNKYEAVKKFNLLLSTKKFNLPKASVAVLNSSYPQGSEKQLIFNLTKRKVPPRKLPFDVGCLVQNVATCFAIYEAVYYSKPLIERLVTFAGGALRQPKNLWLKIGTTIKELIDSGILELCREPSKIVYGGPMMGVALDGLEYPILKGTNGILFLTKEEIDIEQESRCIRCARCVDSCPMNLLPLEYAKLVKAQRFDKLNDIYISDCIECGACTYVCPAKIPIVHYVKIGKKYLPKE